VLERRHVTVDTEFGAIRIKVGRWRDEDVTFAPELEDCRKAAAAAGIPVRRVYERAQQATQVLRAPPKSGTPSKGPKGG
jgi:hypothetical protein